MGGVVYHFSDTIHLPWILDAGELRPTRNLDSGIGHNWFLWGTTNPEGDLTAAPYRGIHGHRKEEWQDGAFHLVRFTLPAAAFLTFNEVARNFADWTAEEIAALCENDRVGYDETGQDAWLLRWDPLRLADVIRVETTSFAQVSDFLFEGAVREWRPLDISNRKELLLPSRKANRLGVRIGRRRFYSEHRPGSSGIQLPDLPAYVPWPNPQNTPRARARRAEARYRAEIEYTQDMALWQRWAESEGLIDEDDEPPLSWKQQQRHQRRQLAAVRAAQARLEPCPW